MKAKLGPSNLRGPWSVVLVVTALVLGGCAEEPGGQTTGPRQPASVSSSQNAAAIDQQVAAILANPHGELPPAQVVRSDPNAQIAEMQIKNDTAYVLTVLYSGPTSQSVVIAARGSQRIALAIGNYRVAAKVDAPDVLPFAGHNSLQGGAYQNTFYIEISPQ